MCSLVRLTGRIWTGVPFACGGMVVGWAKAATAPSKLAALASICQIACREIMINLRVDVKLREPFRSEMITQRAEIWEGSFGSDVASRKALVFKDVNQLVLLFL